MKKDNKIIDDLVKLAGSTFSGVVDMKNDLSEYIKKQIESWGKKMNFITREEFEVLKKLVEINTTALKNLQKPEKPEKTSKSSASKSDAKQSKERKPAVKK